jgi:primosomal replication protein N
VNQVRLRAAPISRSALRYTPAGVAVAELNLRHDGSIIEAGVERALGFEFAAVAIGPVALALDREPLGHPLEIGGFIAPKSRRSSRLIVHITEYNSTEPKRTEYTSKGA